MFWRALREDRAATTLCVASVLVMVCAALATVSPPLERVLLIRHHGTHFGAHVMMVGWPSMYSFVHHVDVQPGPEASPPGEGCEIAPVDWPDNHLPYGSMVDVLGWLEYCGRDRATVHIHSEGRFQARDTVVELAHDGRWVERW